MCSPSVGQSKYCDNRMHVGVVPFYGAGALITQMQEKKVNRSKKELKKETKTQIYKQTHKHIYTPTYTICHLIMGAQRIVFALL